MGDTTVVVPDEGGAAGSTESSDFAAGVATAQAAQASADAMGAQMTAEEAQASAQDAAASADAAVSAAYNAQDDVQALRAEMTAGFEAVTGALAGIADRVAAAPAAPEPTAPAPPTKAEKAETQAAKSEAAPAEKKAKRRGFGAWASG